MRIGVISDTHIPFSADKLPDSVSEKLAGCDMIVHAGDICERSFLDYLGKLAETRAVYGNMDGLEIKKMLPEKLIFEANGKKIGVAHGTGGSGSTFEYVRKLFSKDKADIVIFGHSHAPVNEKVSGVLYFNPGSPVDTIFAEYRSFGIIEIDNGDINAEIVRVDDSK